MKILLALGFLVPAPPQDGGLEPWASRRQPSDVAKKHAEEVSAARHAYAVAQGGTMDGRNCRSPMGCGMSREGAVEQTWESNRAVRMENVGDADVVNPWLSNGRNTNRTFDEIVAAATAPGMSEADKAKALWWYRVQRRYHFGAADGSEEGDLVKSLNVYGYNSCGSDAMMMGGLWRHIGLKTAPAHGVGHCIAQVFYDGRWHLYDGDLMALYLDRDNETVAGEQDIVRDHDLIKRTHTQGILLPETRGTQEWVAGIYGFEGEVTGQRDCYKDGSLKMTLRPGEALVWRWGHLTPAKYHGSTEPALYPDTICNGLWEYRPDFSKDAWKKGAVVENVKSTPEGLAAEDGKTGSVTWAIRVPYVLLGGKLVTEGSGAEFSLSWDGKAWEKVDADLDPKFGPRPARYGYQLRCRLSGAARLKSLRIVNDLQMAPLGLPDMGVGKNAFVYTDETPGKRRVRITHEWVERSTTKPPAAPAAAVFPPDKGEAEGTDLVFKWKDAVDPDGDRIADYHFELSNRADLRFPLSMSFYKMISRTPDKGSARFTLQGPGLLTADRTYYWRVRAKDEKGVWGPWSAIWSFTPRAPNHPVKLAIESGTLRWSANPTGRKPASYRVYGSDERGFSISDQPYAVAVGATKELANPFPANFIAEVKGTEMAVVGPKADPARPVRTYYRVVAVDEKGRRSGPSDYVVAPRPHIYSVPVVAAKAGAPYRYAVLSNRSLGDLRHRQPGGAGFWELERPKFAMVKAPEWLSIDAATGLLSGTPPAAGTFDVEVSATIDREVRKLDPGVLQWGNEKVLSTATERVGVATQKFAVTVTK